MESDEIKPLSVTDFFTGEDICSAHFFQKQVGDKWLLFNSFKEQISDLLFDEIDFGIEELKWARAVYQGKHGIIDCEGKILVDFKYDYVGYYLEDYQSLPESPYYINYKAYEYIEVGIGDKRGLIDKKGNIVVEIKWDAIDSSTFRPDLAVKDGKYWGVIDFNGNIKLPFEHEYDSFYYRDRDFICTEKDGKHGFITANGQLLYPPIFGELWPPWGINPLNETMTYIKTDGKFGVLDHNYKLIAQCKYDGIFNTKLGVIGIALNGRRGYIDYDGSEHFDPPLS